MTHRYAAKATSGKNKITSIKKNGKVVRKNPISKPVDINQNPILDLDLFDENRLYRPMAGVIYKMFPVETMRGCPYTCRFCNSPDQITLYNKETKGGFFRKKRMDLVSKELKHFKNNILGVKNENIICLS